MRASCDICDKLLVAPYGQLISKVVVISDSPGFDDIRNGQAYAGQYGMALRTELGKTGIQPEGISMVTLWQHGADHENCDIEWHIQKVMPLLMQANLILMLGKEVIETFTGYAVGDVSGTIIKSKILKKATIVAGPGIATIGKTPIGELRLSLSLFAEERQRRKPK